MDIKSLLLEAAKEIMAVYRGEKLGGSLPDMAHRLEDAAEAMGEPYTWEATVNGSHTVHFPFEPPEDAYDAGTLKALYLAPHPAAPECPYPCGWRELYSIATKKAAYFASATLDDGIPEQVRTAGIDLGQYAIKASGAMLAASHDEEAGDNKGVTVTEVCDALGINPSRKAGDSHE